MRTTVTIDDELLDRAREYAGVKETSALLREILKDYVAYQAGMRLARLGGTMPDLENIPRRRSE